MKKEYFESYSNLAYNIVGLIVLLVHQDVLFCMALQALGIGSFTYHFYKKKPIFLFDRWAISFVNTVIAGILIDEPYVWAGLVLVHVLYGYAFMGKVNVVIEVAFSSAIALVAIYLNKSLTSFSIILALFAFAFYVRSKGLNHDENETEDSAWHSVWHLLTAGLYYMAIYLNV